MAQYVVANPNQDEIGDILMGFVEYKRSSGFKGSMTKFIYALQGRATTLTGISKVLGRHIPTLRKRTGEINAQRTTGANPGTPPSRKPLSLLSLYLMALF